MPDENTPAVRPEPVPVSAVQIAVFSDDRLFAEGLLQLIVSEPSFEVTICNDPADLSEGEILLFDSRMAHALTVCERLAREQRTPIILVATPEGDDWASHALSLGVRGILSRSARTADMVRAIRDVADGVIWARRRVITAMLDRFASRSLMQDSLQDPSAEDSKRVALEERLSLREREIFRHAATGLANKELAARLEISEATVKVHLTHIFQKLGVRGRAELAAAFYDRGASSRESPPAPLLSFGARPRGARRT